jgi:hypothetical protein
MYGLPRKFLRRLQSMLRLVGPLGVRVFCQTDVFGSILDFAGVVCRLRMKP